MHFVRSGFILFCREYEKCRDFYRDVLELPIMFSYDGKEPLTCFDTGSGYLMVEHLPDARPNQNKLRLNVENVGDVAAMLTRKKIAFKHEQFDWGETLDVLDPEGNATSIRD